MPPELLLLSVLLVGVVLYALTGGADFGAGVWELALGPDCEPRERALIHQAIGPVWEANHVWLIFVLVGLWTAFPIAFAAMCQALFVPLLLALAGIVFRGAAFAFRTYADEDARRTWEWVFALASCAAPFFLGACAGALATGKLEITPEGRYEGSVLTGWLSVTSVYCAFFGVALCAYLASTYLTREAVNAGESELVERWRKRAMANGAFVGVLAAVGLVVMATDAPWLWRGFQARAWPLVATSVVAGVGSLILVARRAYTPAMAASATATATVVLGWAVAQYPAVIPPAITIEAAKAPEGVLWAVIGCLVGGAILLFPALGYLLYLFKSSPEPEDSQGKV
jgi:cytochrome d ubiquinol oxidase subunit II